MSTKKKENATIITGASAVFGSADYLHQVIAVIQGLQLRQTVALETIARRLGAIEEGLLAVIDGNDHTIKVKTRVGP